MTILSWHIEFARPLWLAALAGLPLWIVLWRRSPLRLAPGCQVLSVLLRTFLLAAVAIGLAEPKATGPATQAEFDYRRIYAGLGPVPPPVVLSGPDHVRAGEPFALDLMVRPVVSDATLELSRDSKTLLKENLLLQPGENRRSIPAVVEETSRVVYTVKITGKEAVPPSQPRSTHTTTLQAACPIFVDPPPRVLLVEGQPTLAEPLKKALAKEKVAVELRPQLPDAGAIGQYDLIILSNVPADGISKAQMAALESYVRDGGGLIAVGGDHSFTVGGYRHTPLDEMLPVISESHTTKPKPTLAMVLVLDISGSMNDPVSKGAKERNIDLAKEALRRAVGMLGPRDQVGVLVFEDNSRWTWPLGPVTDKAKIIAKIDTIEAEGETNMYPPLEKAYLALRESFADVKHIIVSTDGIGGPGDFDGLARKMAAAGITMSTVGVGSEPVRPFMQKLADLAKGRAYFCDNGKAIPQIFAAETGAAAKIGITEEPFFPQVVQDVPILHGLDMAKAPALLGYVETVRRPGADVVLAAKTGEPILAMWRYGRGMTAAFTSDIQSRWAGPWLNWRGFGRFWSQLVWATIRHDPPPTSRLTADAADGRLYVTLDAEDRDGRFINGADVKVTVEKGPPLTPADGEGEGAENPPLPPGEGRGEGSSADPIQLAWMVKQAGQLEATPAAIPRPRPARPGGESGYAASSTPRSISRPSFFTTSTSEVGSEASLSSALAAQPDSPPGQARWGRAIPSTTLPMTQIAPGRYIASQPAGTGVYWLNAEIRRDGKPLEKVRGAAAVLSMPETIAKLDGIVEAAEKPGLRTVLLWPWLLGAALILLVLDLALRRTSSFPAKSS